MLFNDRRTKPDLSIAAKITNRSDRGGHVKVLKKTNQGDLMLPGMSGSRSSTYPAPAKKGKK